MTAANLPPDSPVLQPGGTRPADEHAPSEPPTPDNVLRDRKIAVLLDSHHMLSMQIAELTHAQQGVDSKLRDGDKRMGALTTEVSALTVEMAKNTEVTTEVRDLVAAFKGGFKVAGWFGTGLKWCAGIAAAIASLYAAWQAIVHGGKLPGQ